MGLNIFKDTVVAHDFSNELYGFAAGVSSGHFS